MDSKLSKSRHSALGMGLHSIQDSYAHPKGEVGVVKHAAETGIGMYGRYSRYLPGFFNSVAAWKSRYGSVYDNYRNNKKGYMKALRATNNLLAKFWRKI